MARSRRSKSAYSAFEDVVRLLQQFGRFTASATRKLQVGELREQARKEQALAHTARRDDPFAVCPLRVGESIGVTK